MCGIVGAKLVNPSEVQLKLIQKVFVETEVRGKHASGISWFDGEKIQTIKKGIPISDLINGINLSDLLYKRNDDLILSLIGHIRYSTSDIHFHQPLGDETLSIVHNGVITQEPPERWEEHFGYSCETKNDSELIFKTLQSGKDPISEFPDSSISALSLDNSGNIISYRNALRPQWKYIQDNGIIYSSTQNILLRAGANPENIFKVEVENDKQIRTMKELYDKS